MATKETNHLGMEPFDLEGLGPKDEPQKSKTVDIKDTVTDLVDHHLEHLNPEDAHLVSLVKEELSAMTDEELSELSGISLRAIKAEGGRDNAIEQIVYGPVPEEFIK